MNITSILTGALPGVIILAAIFTIPIAFWLVWLYRRTVIRLMSMKVQPTVASLTAAKKASIAPSPSFAASDKSPDSEITTEINLFRRLRTQRWQAATIYTVGGLCFTSIVTILQILASGSTIAPLKFLYLAWVFLFPVCLVVNLVASPHWRTSLIFLAVYFSIWTLVCAIEIAINSSLDWMQVLALWTGYNLLPTILVTAFLYRRIRAVGPMVFTFLAFGFAGAFFLSYMIFEQAAKGSEPWITIVAGLYDLSLSVNMTGFLIETICFLVLAVIGWFVLQILKWLYLHKRQSDLSLILDPIWLTFAFIISAELVFNNPWWFLSGFVAFGVYKIVTWAGFAWLNRGQRKTKGVKLLVLRVFSLGRRSEQLYSAIAKAWRYVGNIQFITGPDLAASTVEPHNFLDFISGKLHRHFIDNSDALERRIAEADILPDLDGRYRILDFFCHDDTWKMVLSRLADESDVILMDLRSFSASNAGCKFEIAELIQSVPANKIVFITDNTTDQIFMQKTVQEAWDNICETSPNIHLKREDLKVIDYKDQGINEFNILLYALANSAML